MLDAVGEQTLHGCARQLMQRYRLVEGDGTRLVASFGTLPGAEFRPISPRNVSGRAILSEGHVHVHDLQEAVRTEFPDTLGLRFWSSHIS